MSDPRYSPARELGREHFPRTPKGFIAIRIVQLILAVTTLGLDAYVLSIVLYDGAELTIFVSIATLIACIYYLVVEFGRDCWKGYNYWAVLALDIFLLIFWLIAFALNAARVAPYANGWTICDGWECIYYPVDSYMTFFACMCTATGLGGIEFGLFIISLAIHSVAMHRHRAAGLHCKAISAFDRDDHVQQASNNNNNAPIGSVLASNTNNNNGTTSNAIPLQEKNDHGVATSYVSSVPVVAQQQPHHNQQQSLYAASPPPPSSSATMHHNNNQSPYQMPPAAPSAQQVGGGGGYYETQQQHYQGGTPTTSSSSYHMTNHTHHSSSFGGGSPIVPAPHPGSYEAPGSPATGYHA